MLACPARVNHSPCTLPPAFSPLSFCASACAPGSVEVSLNLTNPLGHAEQLSLTAEYGSQSTNVYSLTVTKPRPRGLPLLLDARVHQLFHSHQWASSFSEQLRGGMVTLTRWAGVRWLGGVCWVKCRCGPLLGATL